jgi:FkbM family methyltransferase
MNRLAAFIYSAKNAGVGLATKEALRRVFRAPYHYRGVRVSDAETFRMIRNLLARGYKIYTAHNEVVVETEYAAIGVDKPDIKLLAILGEPFQQMYGCVPLWGGVVVDIGACLGETPLFFRHMGARRIYAYEPVHYKYLIRNIRRNHADGMIVASPCGVWLEEGSLGLGSSRAPMKLIQSILLGVREAEGEITLVKMDCEGCEYSLLTADRNALKIPEHYLIEIHGAPEPIIHLLAGLGYKHAKTFSLNQWVNVYHFWRRDAHA